MGSGNGPAERRREWARVVEARDISGYADIVAQDVVWFPPGQPPVVGRDAFTAWLRPFFAAFEYEFTIEPLGSLVADRHACERLRFRSSMRPAGGGDAQVHGGTCIVFWRRDDDGVWRIDRYIDESALTEER